MTIKIQVDKALSEIGAFSINHGIELATLGEKSSREIMVWLQYFENTYTSTPAKPLLNGTRSALIETIGYISFGLGRAAINSIRTEIDLLLSFSYFCDHPVEWETVTSTGTGFMLRADIYKYYSTNNKQFSQNLEIVEKASGTSLTELYKILSAHIHAQSTYTIPKGNGIKDLIVKAEVVESIVELQEKVALALSNFFVTIYSHKWPEIPHKSVERVRSVLSPKHAKMLFP